jgi:hypothetical protein
MQARTMMMLTMAVLAATLGSAEAEHSHQRHRHSHTNTNDSGSTANHGRPTSGSSETGSAMEHMDQTLHNRLNGICKGC